MKLICCTIFRTVWSKRWIFRRISTINFNSGFGRRRLTRSNKISGHRPYRCHFRDFWFLAKIKMCIKFAFKNRWKWKNSKISLLYENIFHMPTITVKSRFLSLVGKMKMAKWWRMGLYMIFRAKNTLFCQKWTLVGKVTPRFCQLMAHICTFLVVQHIPGLKG